MNKIIGFTAAALALSMLSGCAAAAIQGASRAKDNAVIMGNEDAAAAGDVNAQLKMGDAHCCTIAGSAGVLNNQKATEWYCKAARQNEPKAFYELGRIYSGDLVRGMNAPAKAAAMLTTQRENKPLALMWLNLAATAGVEDAADDASDLREDMTGPEIVQATLRQKNWQAQPCEWNAVYPDNQL
ncbi:Sel1 domain protein repeat-containing protein [Parvibaculum lavamentivorans DS-1]|uniref:Sel1 domain protein repeat-containing protein n=1 Tax=Parvibaculum lavamentivorans (strain DS-1 / DSM 13023 / NCIMB 13966) TaxID=402881 RepID=A7HZ40_PARL1|nr:sel1 repeat family protein [Parvibaculum lavamentivorans]ABS65173.1 Sel1 domain protein repeat-containing protein [Parvibaculum lavamentivorans DS-1]